MILEELMLDLMYHLPSNKKVKETADRSGDGEEPQSLYVAAGKGGLRGLAVIAQFARSAIFSDPRTTISKEM
jgi:hypothetical protein